MGDPTLPTPLEVLAEKVQKLPIEETFNKLASAVGGLEKIINSPEIGVGVKNLSQGMEEVKKLVKNINAEIKPLSAGVHEALKDTRNVLKNADSQIRGRLPASKASWGTRRSWFETWTARSNPSPPGWKEPWMRPGSSWAMSTGR